MSNTAYHPKIINDPVHGFISIRTPLAYNLISLPMFQRLRNIKQLGLTYLVYPAACHSRFQHALGTMHVMNKSVEGLRQKGVEITEDEAEAAECAALLHDVGHGPFSHVLEFSLLQNVHHEDISRATIEYINRSKFIDQLSLTLQIFDGTYPKKFLHQLISSQIDVDRMDYLRRDSYFSGVTEGAIGVERLIRMFNVHNNELVIEAKGVHSVEQFLLARRLMYWQVYLHKTVVAAEQLLVNIFKRARYLLQQSNCKLLIRDNLQYFLENNITQQKLQQSEVLSRFWELTDADIESAIKDFRNCEDAVLRDLCDMFLTRRLPHMEILETPFTAVQIEQQKHSFAQRANNANLLPDYFVGSDVLSNKPYSLTNNGIKMLTPQGQVVDLCDLSQVLNTTAFLQDDKKYFLYSPKF
ncbi:phosphohydrolase [Bacteroidia bacterium]|nr:phosphohydrolase [Bacteroidia bacterium]